MRTLPNLITLAACLSLLSACGGGGGGGSSSAPTSPPAVTNQAPSLVVDAEVAVVEGSLEIVTATGTDPENDSLTYSLSGGDDSALFEISSSGGSISFITAPDFEAPADTGGNNSYQLTVQLADSQGATDSQSLVVRVTNALEGRVVDGPLSASTVFVDLNNNLQADAGEPTAQTDSQGYFTLPEPEAGGRLVALGGTDISTNTVLSQLALIADLPTDLASAAVISPISSVIAAADSAEAKAAVLTALGIEGTVDEFLAMDIWALAEDQDDDGLRLQRLNQQIALVITTIQTLDEGQLASALPSLAEDAAAAIAAQISSSGAINLQSTSQLIEVVNGALPDADSLSVEVIAAVAETMADINELLDAETVDPTSAAAIEFVQTTQTELLDSVTGLVESVTSLVEFNAATSLGTLFADNQVYTSQVTPVDNTDGTTDGTTDGSSGGTTDGSSGTTDSIAEGETPVLVDGQVADIWGGTLKFSAFDELNSYGDCTDEQAGTEDCKSIDWQTVSDSDKGDVLQVSYTDSAGHAGIVVGPGSAVDLSDYSNGSLKFDRGIRNWTGSARLRTENHQVALTAVSSTKCFLALYRPEGAPYLCLEPMTQRLDSATPDDIEQGFDTLQAGEVLTLSMTVKVLG
jgi:hypothetical protein